MSEKFQPEKIFTKDSDNLAMLRHSLESGEIDEDIVPILEKFFSLPITPRESCYGHIERPSQPYLSYVDDITQIEQEQIWQKLFREKITELKSTINQKLGGQAIDISLTEEDRGGGPKDYTLYFRIVDQEAFKKMGKKFLDIIWQEFSKYLDELN